MLRFLIITSCFILACLIAYNRLTASFVNHWKLTMVFGKKGAGKTTYLTKQAITHAAKGWTVYSTIDIPFTYRFDPNDLGVYSVPANLINPFTDIILPDDNEIKLSRKLRKMLRDVCTVPPNGQVLILVDEVGMIWDNRNFKNFATSTRDWFKLQRHYRCKVFLFSQSFDVDKKIRDLCDDMWLLVSKFRVFSYGKHILRKLDIIEAQGDSESRLVDQLKFDSLLFAFFGARQLTFIPFWTPLFDSFDVPVLKRKNYRFSRSVLTAALSPAPAERSSPGVLKINVKEN